MEVADDNNADIKRDNSIHDSHGLECDESWCEGCHVEDCEDYKKVTDVDTINDRLRREITEIEERDSI